MGVNLKELVAKREIELKDLSGKKIAIDAYNVLYQFLAAIRQRDGTPLMDSKGRLTSHLAGLFYRTLNLMEWGIKPVFIFDGEAPILKEATQAQRREIREEAKKKYEKALAEGKLEDAKKYAQQTSQLTPEMVRESKELIRALGLPWVQALADGEAQAAYLCQRGMVWAVASQDYDALLFGAQRLIRNLTISGRKKMPGKKTYAEIKIELIDLAETLNNLKIDLPQLIDLATLIGTDYNEGIKGIGPKSALKIIQSGEFELYASKIPRLKQVRTIFLKPAITTGFSLGWSEPNEEKIKQILCQEHNFSEKRVSDALSRFRKKLEERKQTSLGSFV